MLARMPLGRWSASYRPDSRPCLQRAVGDDDAVVLLGPREQLALDAPVDQVVADLVGEHRSPEALLGPLATGRASSC